MTRPRLFSAAWKLCALFVVSMMVWYIWLEPPVIEYTEMPFQVLTPEVRAGESVQIVISRIAHTNDPIEIRITRELINLGTGERTDLLGTAQRKVPSDERVKIVRITVAHSAPTGFFRICGKVIMPATMPGIERKVPWCTQSFHVIAAPD